MFAHVRFFKGTLVFGASSEYACPMHCERAVRTLQMGQGPSNFSKLLSLAAAQLHNVVVSIAGNLGFAITCSKLARSMVTGFRDA
jgi:hypothetical protein